MLDGDLDAQERIDVDLNRLARLEETAQSRIPLLEQKLQSALAELREAEIAEHAAAMTSQFRRLAGALSAAAAENQAAIDLFEDACRRFGTHEAEKRFRRLHYGGLLFSDLVGPWIADTERALAAPAKPKAVTIQQKAAELKVAAPNENKRRPKVDGNELPGLASRRPPITLDPMLPVADGHVAVKVERDFYESPTGRRLGAGDELILPENIAVIAIANGAVSSITASIANPVTAELVEPPSEGAL